MTSFQDILKEKCPRGVLVKNEHFGANCLWDVSRLYSENSIQTLLIFLGVDPKKFRRVCMEFSKHNWATISETICPEMLIFGKWASWTFFFQNILTNPIISEISFLWRHTLVLYWAFWVFAKDWFDAMAHCMKGNSVLKLDADSSVGYEY